MHLNIFAAHGVKAILELASLEKEISLHVCIFFLLAKPVVMVRVAILLQLEPNCCLAL